jgi:hypothetical protein
MTKEWNIHTWKDQLRLSREDTVEALSEYHAGGRGRMRELQEMFREIGAKPVVIISASEAIAHQPGVYQAILARWGCGHPILYFSTDKYVKMAQLRCFVDLIRQDSRAQRGWERLLSRS